MIDIILDAWYDDHAWILIMAVVACVLSFIPVYATTFLDNNNNTTYNFLDPNLREACMSSLFVVLSPAIDSILEFLPLLPPAGEADTKRRDVIGSKSNMTITLTEKSIFVIGILCLSVLYPTLQNTNTDLLVHISTSFFNCSTTFMVCAILSFLCRRSTSFVLWNTRIMVILVCGSGVISSCASMYQQNNSSVHNNLLFFLSNIMFDVATLIYLGTCIYSLFQWVKRIYGKKRSMVADVHGEVVDGGPNATNTENEKPKEITVDESITHFVVGTHMFSTLVIMIVNAVSIWYTPFLTFYQLSIIIYIMIGTAIIVFVTDNLAKRHVTAAALCALLDSKTDYVRYISHEIRTPLSATLMGLRLMLNDFKKSMPRPGSVGKCPPVSPLSLHDFITFPFSLISFSFSLHPCIFCHFIHLSSPFYLWYQSHPPSFSSYFFSSNSFSFIILDADRLDTLQDVNASCVAALDILNDLLCFNKLEAGQRNYIAFQSIHPIDKPYQYHSITSPSQHTLSSNSINLSINLFHPLSPPSHACFLTTSFPFS